MKNTNAALLRGIALASLAGVISLPAAEILTDNYTAPNSTGSFALGSGVNSGINPPTTRLTGLAAPNLRYIQTDANKAVSAYGINSNKLRVTSATGSGRITLSANGSSPYNFGQLFGSLAATKEEPAIYEIGIKMDVDSAGTQRASFAIGTVDGINNTWDFGFQIHRTSNTETAYTISHRVDGASNGLGQDVTGVIHTMAAGTYGTEISILMRITDAGPESITTSDYNSRVQLSLDGGATWFYDTQNDASILNQWRFDAANRFILWDIAGSSVVTYDALTINTIFTPTFPVRTWTGGGTDDNWSNAANWGGTAPVSGNGLVFAGTARQANNNDLTDLSIPFLALNNGGFTLGGNAFIVDSAITNAAGNNTITANLSFGVVNNRQWTIASGSQLTLNNSTSVEVTGDHALSGGGTLRQTSLFDIGSISGANPAFIINEGQHVIDGGTFNSRGGYRIGSVGTGSGGKTILTNNANFTLGVSGANLRVGDSTNAVPAELQVHSSTLTMTGGSLGIPYAAGASAVVTQVGGTVSGAIVAFNDSGAGTGTYTIKNGTLSPRQIRKDAAGGSSAIYFDNAILNTAPSANSNFFSGLDIAEIQAGGLTMDIHSDVAVAQSLSGAGSLTKTGPSVLTLSGDNTYAGNTLVQAGRLVLTTGRTNNAVVQVADGAEFGVVATDVGSSRRIGALSFTGASFNGLHVDLGNFSSPSAPLLKVGNLSVSAPVTVNVANGLQLSTGQIVLVDYDSLSGGFNFTLGSLPPGVTATLVHNTANGSIDLNITGVPGLRWTGASNGEWDYSNQNWLNLQNGSASAYQDGFPIEFRDGAANPNINVSIFPTPAIIAVSNNTQNYTWTGSGITTPTLRKFGAATLTRVGGEIDSITNIELNAGSYVINNSFDATFSTVLSDVDGGTGTLVKQGASTLTVTGNSATYDGAIWIQQGVYKLGSTNTLGSINGATTIASGATLDVNDNIAPHEPVFVSGTGFNGMGAITDTGTGNGVSHTLTDVTMQGDTTFGANSRWDIRIRSGSGPGPGLRGNGFNMTKIGPGALSIGAQRHFSTNQPYWEMNLGDVTINEGSVTFAESVSLGNPSKKITVAAGASLGTFDLNYTNPIVRDVYLTDAAITAGGSAGDTNAFSGTIHLTGQASLRPSDAKLVFDGPIAGSGTVTVLGSGAGAVYFNAVNTFTGETIVSNGVVGGTGVIPGNLTILAGGTAPGMGVGTLTVNGNATLAGTTTMELDRSKSPNSDRLVVNGAPSWSGTLRVQLGAGAPSPQAGDVYQLFNKPGSGSFSSIVLPNISNLPGGLTWNTNNLAVDGTIKVDGTATPPVIGGTRVEGGNFIFSGTGGIEGATYFVLASTNVAAPLGTWTPVSTNTFGPGGSFSYTNSINAGTPATFFLLQLQ